MKSKILTTIMALAALGLLGRAGLQAERLRSESGFDHAGVAAEVHSGGQTDTCGYRAAESVAGGADPRNVLAGVGQVDPLARIAGKETMNPGRCVQEASAPRD
jgi:hypothetical protein